MADSQGEVAVAAGDGGEVPVRALDRLGATGVDDDDLTAAALSLTQERQEVRSGADRVVPPEDDELAVKHVVVRRAPAFAERRPDGALRSGAANASPELAGAEAGPEAPRGDGILHQAERAAVAVRQDRLRSRLGNDGAPAARDFPNGFVPGDAP